MTEQIISRVGHELEGAHPRHRTQSSYWHHDSSVEVCGNNDPDGYDNCDCYECMRCNHSDEQVENCDNEYCMFCLNCGDNFADGDCICYQEEAFDADCDSCKSATIQNDGNKIACIGCQQFMFEDNYEHECRDTYSDCNGDCGCRDDTQLVDGEMVSPPLKPEECDPWIRENYPTRTNTSCGSHQHTSFTQMKYMSIVMDREFQTYMINELLDWGNTAGVRDGSAFYRRLNGEVHWCKDKYEAYIQIHSRDKDECRYRVINYCHLLHGTMEVRVLPAFQDVELSVSAHRELTRIIEQYVRDHEDSLKTQNKTITMEVIV